MENREKEQKWTEYGYIVCLAVFLAYRSFFNTMIRHDFGIKRCKPAELCWMVFMVLLIMIRALYLRCYSKVELLIAVSFCICILLSWRHARVYWFLMVPLLIVGAKGISFDRIVKTFLIVVGAVIGISLILSLTGVITNLRYVRYIDSAVSSERIEQRDTHLEPLTPRRFLSLFFSLVLRCCICGVRCCGFMMWFCLLQLPSSCFWVQTQ